MSKRDIQIAVILLIGIALLPALWAIGIDWIQYDERAVGENSPIYPDDVVNRPAKQIYALYTSEHNIDGTHKPLAGYVSDSVFLVEHNQDGTHYIQSYTPLTTFEIEHNANGTHLQDYVISSELSGYMLKSAYDADTDNRADTAEVLTDGTNISSAAAVRTHLDSTAVHFDINDATTATSSVWSSQKVSDSLLSAMLPLIQDYTEPDITTDTAAFWVDLYSNQFWLILDVSGTQKKVELL